MLIAVTLYVLQKKSVTKTPMAFTVGTVRYDARIPRNVVSVSGYSSSRWSRRNVRTVLQFKFTELSGHWILAFVCFVLFILFVLN